MFDEAFGGRGRPRGHYRETATALLGTDLAALARAVRDAVAEQRIEFRADGGDERFHLDPVPRIVTAEEWSMLEGGLTQRTRALNAFLADAYGEQRIVAEGRIPERIVETAELWEPDMRGVQIPGVHAGVAGFDVVRDSSGELKVLEDNLRTPSGTAYVLAARGIVDAHLPCRPPAERAPLELAELLREAIAAAARDGRPDPNVVVLTDGPENSAWWEHQRLAELLGAPLVTPAGVEQRDGRLLLRDDGTTIDVVYRRTDEDRLRDAAGNPTWLAELLLEPVRHGTLGCVNAFGCGLADDKLVHAYVEEMVRFYLGEEPQIRSVPTYDPAVPAVRAGLLDRIDELVVKPRDGSGGDGVIVCPHASEEDRELAAELVRTRPEDFVVQETVVLSTHPTVVDGELEPRHIDLRAFAFSTAEGAKLLAGGLTRVALDRGALVVNSSQNGGAKDTWMLR